MKNSTRKQSGGAAIESDSISRREVLRHVTALLGGAALVGGKALIASELGAGAEERLAGARATLFNASEIGWLDEVAETILPETSTPGAKAAGVGPYIAVMVTDTFDASEQQVFREGMSLIEQQSRELYGQGFVEAVPQDRLTLLKKLDREQHEYMESKGAEKPVHYFRSMKELTLFGYFTSEIGYKQATRFVETPGRYDPCVPYAQGERAWASSR